MNNSVRVFAPATIANVCCAFDILGFALENPGDEISATIGKAPGITIRAITGDNGKLSRDPLKNSASIAAHSVLRAANSTLGIELSITKKMPLGSGLGSSAASAAAGAFAANLLLGEPFKREELLQFALDGEAGVSARHADNVAPSLLGGFVLIRSIEPLDVVKLPITLPLAVAVVHPNVQVRTGEARGILKQAIALQTAVKQWGNIAALITGLLTNDLPLISRSFYDHIIEPDRAVLIPGFQAVKRAALEAGAIGVAISGSGPSIFALAPDLDSAKECGVLMQREFTAIGIDATVYHSRVNSEGATRLE